MDAVRNTPYDDVFRTLMVDCPELVIPLINEVFGTDFAPDETIVFAQNEHFLKQQDGGEEKRITDSSFRIGDRTFLIECQSTADNSILIRIFEYATQIALEQGELTKNVLTVTIPHTAVLFLRSTRNTPDAMRIRVVTPGGEVEFPVPVKKVKSYTLDMIFERNLVFLIPFYIFTRENQLAEYDRDESKLEDLKAEYLTILKRLTALSEAGELTAYNRGTIIEMTKLVVENLAENYRNVREGVKSTMGGRVLDYEMKRALNKGRAEGRAEGRVEGRAEGAQKKAEETALFLLQNGMMISFISDATGLTEERVREIAAEHGLLQS